MRIKRRAFSWAILAALLLSSFAPVPAAQSEAWQSKVDAWVLETAANGETEFLVYLKEQADLSRASELPTRLEKGAYVYRTLYDLAQRSQKPLLAELASMGVAYQSFYIANMVWVRGDNQVIERLAQRADVAHLYANPRVRLQKPVIPSDPGAPESTTAIEWNITKVNADDVWAAGFTGQGAVVGGQDTGYDWDHPALINQYRGWNGASASHDYNWHDSIHSGGGVCGANSIQPCDDDSHGTHTMGTMVGDDGGSNQIGMAPGARWIGCRNMDEGVGTPATYTECYEWFIAPYPVGGTPAQGDPSKAPDVINNSWGCPPSEGCTNPNVLLTVVQNVRAAGILTAHSAGNSGSSCSTVVDPAAIYAESFTVGATDSNDNIASFSSRGPVTIDGSNRPKPDISAPGVGIRSSVPGGFYQSGWSGTSMAAPHVAGMVALLISADPALSGQVDALEDIIEQSALQRTTSQTCGGVPGSNIPNNTYGWGRIDALAAVQFINHSFQLLKRASEAAVVPGEAITYTLRVTHDHPSLPTANVVLTDTIPAGASLISASAPYSLLGDVVRWDIPSMGPGETLSREMVVQAPAANEPGEVINAFYGVRSDDADTLIGSPVIVSVVPYSLTLTKSAPPAVVPGGTLTYTLQVVNPHPTAAVHNVVLTDVIPANTTFIDAASPYSLNGGAISWQLSDLLAGQNASVWLAVQAPGANGEVITNQDYQASAAEVALVSGTPVETVVQPPELAIVKTAPPSAASGSVLTYTLSISNPHPTAATHNLVLTDTLPAETTFVNADPPATAAGETITWTLPTLEPGATWVVQLAVRAPLTFTDQIVNEFYGVRSDEVATVSGPAVTTEIHSLAVEKSASASLVGTGDLITYTITVTSLHPSAEAHNLVLSDELPGGTAFVSSDTLYAQVGNAIVWQTPSLAPGATWTVRLTVMVLPGSMPAVVNDDYRVRSEEMPEAVMGPPVVTLVVRPIYLPFISK